MQLLLDLVSECIVEEGKYMSDLNLIGNTLFIYVDSAHRPSEDVLLFQ